MGQAAAKIAVVKNPTRVLYRKLSKMLLIGAILGTIWILEVAIASTRMETDFRGEDTGWLSGLGLAIFFASIATGPLSILCGELLLPSLFFAFPSLALALLTNKIWKTYKKTDFLFVLWAFVIGSSLVFVFWVLKGYVEQTTAAICFFLMPLTNLSIPISALLFFLKLKREKNNAIQHARPSA